MPKRRFNLKAFFGAGAVVLTLALSFAAVIFLVRLLAESEYFQVSQVSSNIPSKIDLRYLEQKNIFSLNLKREAKMLQGLTPDCSSVSVIRVLPDKLYIYFKKRTPAALVRLYRYFAVDYDGYFFNTEESPENSSLPVISGLETKIFAAKVGSRYNNPQLKLSLDIIRYARLLTPLKEYRISKISVENGGVSVYIPFEPAQSDYALWKPVPKTEYLQVMFPAADTRAKIVLLAQLFSQQKSSLAKIKYIDLRFKEPLMKFKEENVKQ